MSDGVNGMPRTSRKVYNSAIDFRNGVVAPMPFMSVGSRRNIYGGPAERFHGFAYFDKDGVFRIEDDPEVTREIKIMMIRIAESNRAKNRFNKL